MPAFSQMGIQAVIKGVGAFVGDVGKMQGATDRFVTSGSRLSGLGATMSSGLDKVKTAASNVYSGIGTVAAAVGLAGASLYGLYTQTIGLAINYNKEIKDLSLNLGLATEETGRLVQVADDFGISQQAITGVLEMAVSKGFVPSVENMAKLADEANAFTDPAERAAFLTDKLGRGWKVLWPMLEQGGDAYREMAAAVDSSLAPTEESIKQTEEMRLNIDRLNDKLLAGKLALGNWLARGLNPAIQGLFDMTDALKKQSRWLLETTGTYDQYLELLAQQSTAYLMLTPQLSETEYYSQKLALANQGVATSQVEVTETAVDEEAALKRVEDATRAAEQAAKDAESANTSMFQAVAAGPGSIFDKLGEFQRQAGLGGGRQVGIDKQIEDLIASGQLGTDLTQKLVDTYLPKSVFDAIAKKFNFEMGDTMGPEMLLALRQGLLDADIPAEAAEQWFSYMVTDPQGFISGTQDVLEKLLSEPWVMAMNKQDVFWLTLDSALGERRDTFLSFWIDPINEAIRLKEELLAPPGTPATSSPTVTSPRAWQAAVGDTTTNNFSQTINTAARHEQVAADFGLMQALSRRR